MEGYLQLTQVEAAFHICKNDLRLRPVWHQKEERVKAFILVCLLAFVLCKTLDPKKAERRTWRFGKKSPRRNLNDPNGRCYTSYQIWDPDS